MVELYKSGRVIIILNGKHAGKKGFVIESSKLKNNPTRKVLILGIKKELKNIKRNMKNNKILNRLKFKTFFKMINVKHVFPTRYVVEIDETLKNFVEECCNNILNSKNNHDNIQKEEISLTQINNYLQGKLINGKNTWLFKKLNF
mmetsp:Transcript_6294/g.14469  ORF Transcript_6294/g.14469 Transcript_6294/m.14469 type:complete len:145 (-) Transcript_6294:1002-1436(-)